VGTKVNFVERPNGPERLVCEAEVVFEGEAFGPLAGLKLVGFSLWRSAEGEVYVSLPSRAFGRGSERRYFDLLRTTETAGGTTGDVRGLKAWIIAEARRQGRIGEAAA